MLTDEQKELAYYKVATRQSKSQGFPMPPYVPSRVAVTTFVRGDGPGGYATRVAPGEYDCESNKFGAVSVRAGNGKMLGLRPAEFEVVGWRENKDAEAIHD